MRMTVADVSWGGVVPGLTNSDEDNSSDVFGVVCGGVVGLASVMHVSRLCWGRGGVAYPNRGEGPP